ncbi:Acyl-CoA thioesterase 8 [Thoreauomyces humboldtii]|nr:Acyl-CoA thioesterase 8 [Thoreauomyces humboldtii]
MDNANNSSTQERLRTLIEDGLELEEIDLNLFRSRHLWLPAGARGVFGGQVVGLALSAATKTVDAKYRVHSLHCYFLLPGDNTIPIIYRVQRNRDGKSYVTRTVMAEQRGKSIFLVCVGFRHVMTCPKYPMPDVLPPEQLKSTEEKLQHMLEHPRVGANPKYRQQFQMRLQDPIPIDIRDCHGFQRARDLLCPTKKEPKQYLWMRAKGKLPDDPAFHNCVAAYCSDHYLLTTSLLAHGITGFSNPRLSMLASLDHSVWFHAPFRADEWLLYEMESSRTIAGRGLCFGRIFTRDGRLVVSTAQEGVVRAEYRSVESIPKQIDGKAGASPSSLGTSAAGYMVDDKNPAGGGRNAGNNGKKGAEAAGYMVDDKTPSGGDRKADNDGQKGADAAGYMVDDNTPAGGNRMAHDGGQEGAAAAGYMVVTKPKL